MGTQQFLLLLPPPDIFSLLWHGFPLATVLVKEICSGMVSHWAVVTVLAPGAPSPPSLLLNPVVSHLFFPLLCLSSIFCPFLSTLSQRHHQFGWWCCDLWWVHWRQSSPAWADLGLRGVIPSMVTQYNRRQEEAAPQFQFLHQLTVNTFFGWFGTYQSTHFWNLPLVRHWKPWQRMRFYYIKHPKKEMS